MGMCRSVCEAVVSHVRVDRGGGFAIFGFMQINDPLSVWYARHQSLFLYAILFHCPIFFLL